MIKTSTRTGAEEIQFGQKAQIKKETVVDDSTSDERLVEEGVPIIVKTKVIPGVKQHTVYIVVNMGSKQKREMYRKINRALGEG